MAKRTSGWWSTQTALSAMGIALIALVLLGGGRLFLCESYVRFPLDEALRGCVSVRQAAELSSNDDPRHPCPSTADLVASHRLSQAKEADPWGAPYIVQCELDGTIHVVSAGRDGVQGTEDDVRDDMRPSEFERLKRYMDHAR